MMMKETKSAYMNGVADGIRTHDNRNHNPGLYQLSYSHHLEPPRLRSDGAACIF